MMKMRRKGEIQAKEGDEKANKIVFFCLVFKFVMFKKQGLVGVQVMAAVK